MGECEKMQRLRPVHEAVPHTEHQRRQRGPSDLGTQLFALLHMRNEMPAECHKFAVNVEALLALHGLQYASCVS